MTAYTHILLEERNGVGVLTLNHPESRNPLTEETKEELLAALDEVEHADHLRALIITAQGAAFCAGGDLKKIGQELTPEEITRVMEKSQKLLLKLLTLEKPILAAVNGDAFGMGFNLVLAADFAIASETARFSEVFIKLGLVPDFGALYLLPRLIGLWKTKELVFLGGTLSARDAREMGLIYKVVAPQDLQKEAMDLAGRLAQMPTRAIGRAKQLLSRTFDLTLGDVLEEEIKAQISLSRTEDHHEAIRAFLEKRPPTFQGK
jgi:2-(1,2-epoxy-1,2-dihydrophenyl)acetyl-CoA isomerase